MAKLCDIFSSPTQRYIGLYTKYAHQ